MSFMICAYADESGDKSIYSMSALLGKLSDFVELGRRWRRALQEESIPEFHAAKLENHRRPYDGSSFDADRRAYLQRKFIGLITELPIWGFATFVEIEALATNDTALARFMSHREPYTLSFRMAVEVMALEVDGYRVKHEPIAFVFDQQKQYEGKANEIYDYLSTDGNWPLAYRLGSISFESRLHYVELQAADTWAYESRKFATDTAINKNPERWQMRLFKHAGRFNVVGYTKETLPRLIASLERER